MNYRTIVLKSRTSGAYRTARTTTSIFVCDERLHDYDRAMLLRPVEKLTEAGVTL